MKMNGVGRIFSRSPPVMPIIRSKYLSRLPDLFPAFFSICLLQFLISCFQCGAAGLLGSAASFFKCSRIFS